jgi:hypothetical protein
MPELGGQGGHWPPLPNIWQISQCSAVNPISTGGGQIMPTITTGPFKVLHLPASLKTKEWLRSYCPNIVYTLLITALRKISVLETHDLLLLVHIEIQGQKWILPLTINSSHFEFRAQNDQLSGP